MGLPKFYCKTLFHQNYIAIWPLRFATILNLTPRKKGFNFNCYLGTLGPCEVFSHSLIISSLIFFSRSNHLRKELHSVYIWRIYTCISMNLIKKYSIGSLIVRVSILNFLFQIWRRLEHNSSGGSIPNLKNWSYG